MKPKAKRNTVICSVTSVLVLAMIIIYVVLATRSLSSAFPGEPFTNPRIYNQPGVLLSFLVLGLISIFSVAAIAAGSNVIRKSREQGVKPSPPVVLGFTLGMLNQIMLIALMGFHAYLMIQFATMK
ncbi:MAG: hypothetical protein PVF70_05070 [Anaerolineales bacterium]|jgi:hypothetical protein